MKVHLTNYIRGNNDINYYDDWKIQVNEYDCYLKSIRDQCDKRLLNLYEKSDRFHDSVRWGLWKSSAPTQWQYSRRPAAV